MSFHGRHPRPLKRAHHPSVPSSPAHLREKTAKKLALRPGMGLLRNKPTGERLSDVEQRMLEHELAIAEELQANLLPRKIPQIPGYDLNAYYRPSREVGGDYYDFIRLDDDHLGILVADVAGKGIPGSIVMTETRALVKSEASRTLSPAEVLIRVNRTLYQDIKRGMFVTLYYAILSLQKAILRVVSAGHNPLVLWRQSTRSCHLVNPNGLAMGIDKGPLFDKTIQEQRIQLYPGDRFVIYSDGVVETMNLRSQLFGSERFYRHTQNFSERSSSEFISLLVRQLEEYQGTAAQHDDITIVTGRMLPTSLETEETFIEEKSPL